MQFEEALRLMKQGHGIRRSDWSGRVLSLDTKHFDSLTVGAIKADDWEVVKTEEELKQEERLQWLKEKLLSYFKEVPFAQRKMAERFFICCGGYALPGLFLPLPEPSEVGAGGGSSTISAKGYDGGEPTKSEYSGTFTDACMWLILGKKVRRKCWKAGEYFSIREESIYLFYSDGYLTSWCPRVADMQATDWGIVG